MNKRHFWAYVVAIAIVIGVFIPQVAAASSYTVSGSSYELTDDSAFNISKATGKSTLCYGKRSLGNLTIGGALDGTSSYQGVPAYGVTGEVAFSYSYGGEYQDKDKYTWNLESSDAKNVAGVSLSKKVSKGAVIVQRSSDGRNWETILTDANVFNKNTVGLPDFFVVSESDAKTGYFYRVMIAYRMSHRTGTDKFLFFQNAQYEYREFLEVYDFYICYNQNPVKLRDIVSGRDVSTAAFVSKGFIIDQGHADVTVSIKKDAGTAQPVEDLTSVYQPGKYTVTVTTDLGRQYKYNITVREGLKFTTLSPVVHVGGKNGEYVDSDPVKYRTEFGMTALSSLKIAQGADTRITRSTVNGVPAYGITGDNVSLYLRLRDFSAAEDTGWSIVSDAWGKKEKQTINGTWTGAIETGALVIQKSYDGVEWTDIDDGAYASGLFTTDFYSNYSDNGDVLIYTPAGTDLLNGIYLRVLYAYKAENSEAKEAGRYLEAYEFYLCSSELSAVTFHNIPVNGTTRDAIEATLGEENKIDVSVYEKAETLVSGSGTVTGFTIDTSLNPTVSFKVNKNGVRIASPRDGKYTASGRYVIELESAVGDKDSVVIYVDTQDAESALEEYFGDSFISGKRIYSEGGCPVFEGGHTSYSIKKTNENYLPITGTIQNTTTGTCYDVVSGETEIIGYITEPGQYVATFTTEPQTEDPIAGDYRVFTFRFGVIAEGTAPGPQENQQSLSEYALKNVSDSYPMYYGLTYQSASTGNITLAFATKEAAIEYAYNYEKGMVEQQENGTYRYNGSFYVAQKEKYDSAWDLTDAMYFFAEQAVQKLYFDLSDQFTYLTLEDELIQKISNLRTLELNRSVTIFADGQREELCSVDWYPIISPKPYSYLNPGQNGKVNSDYYDYEFVKDKYGYDSAEVTIIDERGREYPVQYNSGVGAQLQMAGCPSGIVTIRERTVYGDEVSYHAVFIAKGENTASLMLRFFTNGVEQEEIFTQSDHGKVINVDAFRVSEVIDNLDPYTLVTISDANNEYFYVADRMATDAWSTPGEYEVEVTNRLGFSYSINVIVNDSGYATLEFAGTGAENTQTIITTFGEKNVALPVLTRYGYELAGFTDDAGNLYTGEIAEIMFKGTSVFNVVWKAKQYTLQFVDSEGNEILAPRTVEFGHSYDLPALDMTQYDGWSMNGQLLSSDKLTVDAEGDIKLVGMMKKLGGTTPDPIPAERSYTGSIITAMIVLVAGAGVAFAVAQKRKKETPVQGPVEEEQQE